MIYSLPAETEERQAWLQTLKEDPDLATNPLLPLVEQLLEETFQQRKRLHKLMRIADGFDELTHKNHQTLLERSDRQLRRLEKIARISDLYQRNMVELNDSLRRAALKDHLTGLPNRRSIMESLSKMANKNRRKQDSFCLAMIDLDYFKRINDSWGHEMGDLVLCETAEEITGCLRDSDICGRWGGEEFLILLTNISNEDALAAMERVRGSLKIVQVSVRNSAGDLPETREFSLGASIGLTRYRGDEHYEDTIGRADDAMYRAKSEGRNRVITDW